MGVERADEAFDELGVRMSPDSPGVYVLFRGDRTIFIGTADESIRHALESHKSGGAGRLTSRATGYGYELTGSPHARLRERELLDAYKTVHNMNVPDGNRYLARELAAVS